MVRSLSPNTFMQVSVATMTPDGPAATAGIKVGDILKEIDGVDVFRRPVKEFSHLIYTGASGSIVELTMLKKSNNESYTARVQRVHSSSISLPPLPTVPGSPGEKQTPAGSPVKQADTASAAAQSSSVATGPYDPNKGVVGFSVLKNPQDARWEIDQIFPDTPAANDKRLVKGAVIMKLNGESVMEMKFPQLKDIITCPPNTDLKITLKKGWFGTET